MHYRHYHSQLILATPPPCRLTRNNIFRPSRREKCSRLLIFTNERRKCPRRRYVHHCFKVSKSNSIFFFFFPLKSPHKTATNLIRPLRESKGCWSLRGQCVARTSESNRTREKGRIALDNYHPFNVRDRSNRASNLISKPRR
ncbi:hypothetical protein PUN28_018221 [Cardiocondyla obscurior]|uniref:Uncharacterized protein n=1 Tax=Cardiocondyla obscurior TaxID=286306 RepID=A0AAW2EJ53_9HYME